MLERHGVERPEDEFRAAGAGRRRGGVGDFNQVVREDALQERAGGDAVARHGTAGRQIVRPARAAQVRRSALGDPGARLFRRAHARVEADRTGPRRIAPRQTFVHDLLRHGRGVAVHVVSVVTGNLHARRVRTSHRRADVHAVDERARVVGELVGKRQRTVEPHGTRPRILHLVTERRVACGV